MDRTLCDLYILPPGHRTSPNNPVVNQVVRMSQINCDSDDKERFDELKPEDKTQAEFFSEVMQIYQAASEPTIIDSEDIVKEIKVQVASQIELAAYKGITEAKEEQ